MAAGVDDEIIAAPGTPLGHGAIGIIRLSGSGSVALAEGVFKPRKSGLRLSSTPDRLMNLGYICNGNREPLDEVLLVVMRGPHSYTRQDVVEIHSHGGLVSVGRIMEQLLKAGARMAEPGEFTRRAWLNGRLDLAQAEAVLDLIRARSGAGMDNALSQLRGGLSGQVKDLRGQLRRLMAEVEAGIDFPDDVPEQDGMRLTKMLQGLSVIVDELLQTARSGRIFREGLAVVLLGKPNAGKSTLLNNLLGAERALVTDLPGTTRDMIEEAVSIRGIPVRLIDTAGIREDAGVVELLGIDRAKKEVAQADLVMAIFDATTPLDQDDRMVLAIAVGKECLLVLNKIDADRRLLGKEQLASLGQGCPVLEISARLGWGRQDLEQAIVSLVGAGATPPAPAVITRVRHQAALQRVSEALGSAMAAIMAGLTLDCVAVDLWDAWSALGEILGEAVPGEIIDAIFQEFCVGK
jgi:tRNA modification GTPase